jgi:hypothetical protein
MRGFLLILDGFLYLNRTSDTWKDAVVEATYICNYLTMMVAVGFEILTAVVMMIHLM